MAYLIDEQKLERVYLKSYHTIGRYKFNVDTLIDKPGVSRHHAIIELNEGKWFIRDVSTNGIWINDKKVDKNLPYQLFENDKIDFAGPGQNSFVAANLATECQYLVSQSNPKKVIEVGNQFLLPNEKDPTHIIYFEKLLNYWFLEDLVTSDRQALIDGGSISVMNDQWTFYSATSVPITKQLSHQIMAKPISLEFSVSQDEEDTHLTINSNGNAIDLGSRSHHYLLLLLARARIEDKDAGLDTDVQGWIYREDLAKSLGIQMNHMNIMVHRAKKQLTEALDESHPSSAFIIEARCGQIRVNCQDITIIKGSKLETRMSL
ncbi:FHA domain-containing protein (plasmid) [Pseudoalteromonas sp. T1lg65]|uniref:FHA domain-containing protein n=1 Tax=Pseudoalteromonas sp. T1lg65 TaxID=2077101 RepID=UPI003F793691